MSNTKRNLLFVAAVLVLTALPWVTFADWGDVAKGFLDILTWIGQKTLVAFASVALHIAAGVFDWVLSQDFNQIPLTHGIVVDTGWIILRDFANMFFVATMVIMAVATMLGVEKYSWRNLLPRLIIAALLVNFSKLIAGVIVDFANLIMLFFIQNGIDSATNPNQGIGTVLSNAMGLAKLFSSSEFLQNGLGLSATTAGVDAFIAMILQFFFLFTAAITLLLIAVTLILRIIRIWMLVVFAPLVAVAFILPATEGYWKKWLSEFTKWTFLGVSSVFFVYMAALLTQAIFTQGDLGGYLEALTAIKDGRSPNLAFLASTDFIGKGAPILVFVLVVGLLIQGRNLARESAGQAGKVVEGFATSKKKLLFTTPLHTPQK